MSENILKKLFQPSGRGKIWRLFALIIVMVIIGGLIDAPEVYNKGVDRFSGVTNINLPKINERPFRLGLDLQGGTHLVYRADMSAIDVADQVSALEGVRDVIERRVNVYGVSEPIVQTSVSDEESRVIVELAGVKDVNEAIEMIGETPLLEFKEQAAEVRDLTDEEREAMEKINTEADAKAEELLGKLLSGGDFEELAKEYNQDEKTLENGGDLGWMSAQTNPEFRPIFDMVSEWEVGDFTKEVEKAENGYEFYKLEDKRAKTNPFDENEVEKELKASHILICHNEIEGCEDGLSKDEAYAKIKDLKEQATPGNFAALAEENSTGPSASKGGDLGWFGKGAMVKPFEDTAFATKKGEISWVVETQHGYHLIYAEDEREFYEYKLRVIFIGIVTEQDIIGDQLEWKNTELTGKNLDRSIVQFDPNSGIPQVSLQFDDEGADLFEQITERNVGKPVAIYLDAVPISVPNVNEKISGGKAVISGDFSVSDAQLLAQRLNAGALPVPIEMISQQTVGATLGQASLDASLKAALIGLLLVAVFMIAYYRLPGVLAVFSLCIYGILVLAVFKMWPVTLTLSGLAGFILSIGMAVDANVLIFERLKEELKEGKPLSLAVEDSFNRSWPSIRDGNVSTLITCFILIQFTTSIVKGFAITLGLGVLISMFSAIVITKTFLQLASLDWLEKKAWLIGVKK